MSDLFDDDGDRPGRGQPGNAPEFTVGELSSAIKKTIEGSFGRVRVRGEVGRVMRAGSGHMYYDLKDDRNVISCTTWKGQVPGLGMIPEEGLEVIATGKLSTFGPQSRYNLNVDSIEVAGEGALMAMLEKRRKALAAEGLFDADRKQPLPYLPEIIGVVTSPSGAVIRDILHRLRDRFPRKVILWPVVVQGERCAPQVAEAIAGFNRLTPGGALPRPDVLIVARGGGSLEDLWGFNEEVVVRAAAASAIPLISAVGHETDTTLIDFAADRRAPTPTAAAEMAVPVRADLAAHLAMLEGRRKQAAATTLERRGQRLRDLGRALPRADALLGERRQGLDAAAARLPQALARFAGTKRVALGAGRAGRFGSHLLGTRLAVQGQSLAGWAARLPRALEARTGAARAALAGPRLRPTALIVDAARARQLLDRLAADLAAAPLRLMADRTARVQALGRMLATLGYRETLARGFAVVRGPSGDLVRDAGPARAAAGLEIEFHDGRVAVTPQPGDPSGETSAAPSKPVPRKRAARAKGDPDTGQGSLF